MQRPLLLRGARQLLTLRGPEGPRRGADCLDLGVINDGSVLIRDGRILCVGQSRRIDNLAEARNAVVHEVNGAVVMPAFVDASSSIPESALLSSRFLDIAFAHGSGAISGRAPYGVFRALAAAPPFRASLVSVLDVRTQFDEAQLARAARRRLAQELRIEILAHTRAALHFFHSLALPVRAYSAPASNPDWMGLALAYGASTLEVNLPLNRAQIALLADSPACAIVTPAAAETARGLMDSHAAVALGSGFGTGAGATCSMQAAALAAACEGGLDLAEAITLATINAAHALGIANDFGSLEAGKRADILVLHLSGFREMSDYNGVNVVSKIYQAGTLVA